MPCCGTHGHRGDRVYIVIIIVINIKSASLLAKCSQASWTSQAEGPCVSSTPYPVWILDFADLTVS